MRNLQSHEWQTGLIYLDMWCHSDVILTSWYDNQRLRVPTWMDKAKSTLSKVSKSHLKILDPQIPTKVCSNMLLMPVPSPWLLISTFLFICMWPSLFLDGTTSIILYKISMCGKTQYWMHSHFWQLLVWAASYRTASNEQSSWSSLQPCIECGH